MKHVINGKTHEVTQTIDQHDRHYACGCGFKTGLGVDYADLLDRWDPESVGLTVELRHKVYVRKNL